MKVKELVDYLTQSDIDQEATIVLSRDGEGNGFEKMYCATGGWFFRFTDGWGEFSEEFDPEEDDEDNEYSGTEAIPALCFWPEG